MKIYLCTGNRKKAEEYNRIAGRKMFKWKRVRLEEPQEATLERVAVKKVEHAFSIVKKPVVVEDSGLFIKALRNFPGVYSSYVYSTIGVDGILKLLEGVKERSAYFKCVIALKLSEKERPVLFKGVCYGSIAEKARGSEGFGFDPIFIPRGYDKTFAEDIEMKNRVSHRYRAIKKLVENLLKNSPEIFPMTHKPRR